MCVCVRERDVMEETLGNETWGRKDEEREQLVIRGLYRRERKERDRERVCTCILNFGEAHLF